MTKVFLDAGHGGKDPGALGNGLREKDIALLVMLKIGNILEDHGVTVGYSRTTDVFLELGDRAARANNFGSNVFVSIHCNAFTDISAKGVETYSYTGSTAGTNLSKSIQNSVIASGTYTINRGTKTANFAVLRFTNMTAALVELAFITNPQDASILRNSQNDLAVAVSKGILSYLGISYQGDTRIYRVQAGAFTIRANSDKLANELRGKGYSPLVITSGGLYKVQVGSFDIKLNAEALVNELKAIGYKAIVVTS